MAQFIYPDESYKIIGACFDVYKTKGCGFLAGIFIKWAKAQIFNFLTNPSLKAGAIDDILRNRTLVHHYQILWIIR